MREKVSLKKSDYYYYYYYFFFYPFSWTHNILQALWPFLFFFFFCLGGCSTTLMAASNTAFTFCSYKHQLCESMKPIKTMSPMIRHSLFWDMYIFIYIYIYESEINNNLLCFGTALNVSSSSNQLPQLFPLFIKSVQSEVSYQVNSSNGCCNCSKYF